MIYSVEILNDYGEKKQFYITADDPQKLYRRIASTYGILKDRVEILAEYEETDDWGYKLKKSHKEIVSEEETKNKQKANELYRKASRKCEPYKSEAKKKYGFNVVNIASVEDIIPLLKEYKKVKVYWELGEKRGEHKYYAFVE